MKRIMLDPGHGGKFPGAIFNGVEEKEITLEICQAVADLMNSKEDWEVSMTRTGDYHLDEDKTTDLNMRAYSANKYADILISVHCNADPDEDLPGMPEAKGEEIWIREDLAGSRELAEALKHYVDEFFPDEPFRGIKPTTGLRVLNKATIPACLIEFGFIDNSITFRKLKDPTIREDIALMLGTGIEEYFKRKEGDG